MNDFWVFGYGSLMWQPGFSHVEARKAKIFGYRRSLCIYSHHHRGTQERPGLVLGLDRGGSCLGMAFRVEAADSENVLSYLREREQVASVYLERHVPVLIEGHERVRAVIYVADRNHEQYAGMIDTSQAVRQVAGAVGKSGRNEDYVLNTVRHLQTLGIHDRWLETVAAGLTL